MSSPNRQKFLKRNALLKDSGNTCHYCQVEMQTHSKKADNFFTLDHVVPQCRGGEETVPCCLKCNREKAAMTYKNFQKRLRMRRVSAELKDRTICPSTIPETAYSYAMSELSKSRRAG